MSTQQPSPEVVKALSRYDSPTVCNVIELFDVRPRTAGYMNPSIKALFPEMPPMVGFATTASFRSSWPAAPGELQVGFFAHLEALETLPQPRVVVFEDLDEPPAGATFGEVMCTVYQRLGCAGIITSGAARDLDALRRLRFPTFAASVVVSHAWSRVEDVHQPAHVGGITVRPGDLIHADTNGVVIIPVDIAERVAAACPLYVEAERMVLDYAGQKDATVAGIRTAYQGLRERLGRIAAETAVKPDGLV